MLFRELRQYTNLKIFFALVATIGVSLVATIATIATITALLVYRQGAQARNDTRVQLEMLLTDLGQAETGQRGYLLTQEESYLNAYREGIQKIPAQLAFIESNTGPEVGRADVAKLRPLVDQKLAELAQTIRLEQAGDITGSMAVVQTGNGRLLMSGIEDLDLKLQAAENIQLTKDRQRITNLAVLARDIALVSMAAILGLTLLVYWLYVRAIQRERALDRAKDEFVSLASHQLRTPATGIKSILSTIVAGDFGSLNDRQMHFMKRALESNERELGIIEELLNVAKADAGRLVLHTADVELSDLVEAIASEQRASIERKGQTLTIHQPAHPLSIVADQEKLYMAIGNLLDNARKYTPDAGKISIAVARHRGGARVEVADSGIGIGEDEISHIFDRFQRASDAVRGNVEGAGLGLYLAKRIAELHNGTIEVSSRLGKGTKFVMIIPEGERHATEGTAG